MTATWMIYGLLVGAILATVAISLEGVAGLLGWPRRWVWAGAMLGSVVLVSMAPSRTPAPVDPPEPPIVSFVGAPAEFAPLTVSGVVAEESMSARLRHSIAEGLEGAVIRLRALLPINADSFLGYVWFLSSLVVTVVVGATHVFYSRLRRGWPATELHGRRVRLASDMGPAVIGLRRPEIVVPRWLLGLHADQCRMVLDHENEHVRARDPLLLGFGWAVVMLLPWSPASWWMLSRLRLAVEVDCDARVLVRGASRISYGSVLIDLAGHTAGRRIGMAALADESTHLERRLLAMTPQKTRFGFARSLALGSLGLAGLLVACEATLPTAADVANMDVASAEVAARRAALIDRGDQSTVYVLDGVVVTREAARAVAPVDIGGLSFARAGGEDGPSVMSLTTRAYRDANPDGQGSTVVEAISGASERAPVQVPTAGSGAGGRGGGFGDGSGAVAPRAVTSGTAASASALSPVILVDGIRLQTGRDPMAAIPPASIESISVLKGAEATRLVPDAVDGLVVIRTRGGPDDGLNLPEPTGVARVGAGSGGAAGIEVRAVAGVAGAAAEGGSAGGAFGGTTSNSFSGSVNSSGILTREHVEGFLNRPETPTGVYVLDGVRSTRAAILAIPEGEIQVIGVAGGGSIIQQYGPEAEKGVVQVITKAGAARGLTPGMGATGGGRAVRVEARPTPP